MALFVEQYPTFQYLFEQTNKYMQLGVPLYKLDHSLK